MKLRATNFHRAGPLDPEARQGDVARKGVQSIEVGGEILRVLSRHVEPMPLKEIANEAGMTTAKAHPYLVGFCKVKLTEQDASSGHYRLGALALRLGLTALDQSESVQQAILVMESLTERVRHTAVLTVWSQHGPTVVHMAALDFPVETNLRVGSTMSILSTATGQVFAAFLPASVTAGLVHVELVRVTRSIHERAELESKFLADVEHARTRKMARALGHPLPGINAMCAPVFHADGRLALTITVYGPEETFDTSWLGPIAKELKRCCSFA